MVLTIFGFVGLFRLGGGGPSEGPVAVGGFSVVGGVLSLWVFSGGGLRTDGLRLTREPSDWEGLMDFVGAGGATI